MASLIWLETFEQVHLCNFRQSTQSCKDGDYQNKLLSLSTTLSDLRRLRKQIRSASIWLRIGPSPSTDIRRRCNPALTLATTPLQWVSNGTCERTGMGGRLGEMQQVWFRYVKTPFSYINVLLLSPWIPCSTRLEIPLDELTFRFIHTEPTSIGKTWRILLKSQQDMMALQTALIWQLIQQPKSFRKGLYSF